MASGINTTGFNLRSNLSTIFFNCFNCKEAVVFSITNFACSVCKSGDLKLVCSISFILLANTDNSSAILLTCWCKGAIFFAIIKAITAEPAKNIFLTSLLIISAMFKAITVNIIAGMANCNIFQKVLFIK